MGMKLFEVTCENVFEVCMEKQYESHTFLGFMENLGVLDILVNFSEKAIYTINSTNIFLSTF